MTFGDYGNYPGAYGAPWAGGPGYPGYGSPFVTPVYRPSAGMPGNGPGDTYGHDKPKKQGGITGFFQGIAQGGVNMIKGIFSPGGILMLGVVGALTWMTAGAILPILGAIGAGLGGYQILKGIANGDTGKMGEGVFALGTSMLGFLGPEKVLVGGKNYQLAGSGFKSQVSALFGGTKYHLDTDATKSLNLYQVVSRQVGEKFSGLSTSFRPSGSASADAAALRAEHEQMITKILSKDAFCKAKLYKRDRNALLNMQYKLENNQPLTWWDKRSLNEWDRQVYLFENRTPKAPSRSLWSRMFRRKAPQTTSISGTQTGLNQTV